MYDAKYFVWLGENSELDHGLMLINREADTPEEKEILEDLPYDQGVSDQSSPFGVTNFKMRKYAYTMVYVYNNMADAERKRREVVNWLKRSGRNTLLDSTERDFRITGKFTKVDYDIKAKHGVIEFYLEFTAMPLMVGVKEEGHKWFDDLILAHDVIQRVNFTVNGVKNIKLKNKSVNMIIPNFVVTGNITIKTDSLILHVNQDVVRSDLFALLPGMNYIELSGNGTIKFVWHKELL